MSQACPHLSTVGRAKQKVVVESTYGTSKLPGRITIARASNVVKAASPLKFPFSSIIRGYVRESVEWVRTGGWLRLAERLEFALDCVEPPVDAILCHEFFMGAHFANGPFFYDHDAIRIPYR